LSSYVGSLHGVDLSPEMVEKARERGLYASLAVADLTDYLLQAAEARLVYAVAVATDVFVYIGDLGAVLPRRCCDLCGFHGRAPCLQIPCFVAWLLCPGREHCLHSPQRRSRRRCCRPVIPLLSKLPIVSCQRVGSRMGNCTSLASRSPRGSAFCQ
jgi:hypothetical protein